MARFEYSTLVPAKHCEGPLDFLTARGFSGKPFVNRWQSRHCCN
jgi:hypothetical protein